MLKLNSQNHFYKTSKGSEALALAEIAKQQEQGIIHICKNDNYAGNFIDIISKFSPEIEILELPAWDTNPYDKLSPNQNILSTRLKTLTKLTEGLGKNKVLVTTVNALLTRIVPKEVIENSSLILKPGQEISRDKITKFLINNAYYNVGAANEAGEFALRGSIIDIIPAGFEYGIRIDFFGDEIESIRKYDPLTQISSGKLEVAELIPASEAILAEEYIKNFKTNFIQKFGVKESQKEPMFEAIAEGRRYQGAENYLPFFYNNLETIFDYAPDAIISFEQEAKSVITERVEAIKDAFDARNIAFKDGLTEREIKALEPEYLYLNQAEIDKKLSERNVIYFDYNPKIADESGQELNYSSNTNYFAESKIKNISATELLKQEIADLVTSGKAKLKKFIACISEGSRERIKKIFNEHEIETIKIDNIAQEQGLITKNKIALIILPIESGFETDKIKLITEAEILGEKIYRKSRSSSKAEDFIKEAATLSSGELIVHKEHGIGRFLGLETLDVKGILHDFIKLEYLNADKLYVPVENVDMLSRYGQEGSENTELDKLGGLNWQERTARVKKRIREIAGELIQVAATRELRKGQVFESETGLYDEFCNRFPYVETEDQLNAINAVLNDISSGKPMDRLICGDVGFGKTEVALRAAFVATQNNINMNRNQVAVICPTTLLCRQHYKTFIERFAGTGVKVKQLSRLVSATEAKKTKQEIEEGEVDIIVGTHALLAKNIDFKNLSLVIIDEEQRFGVAQKERLKKLREETHILTLTATPIPRTLQLSLAGVRELSLIATPPVDRLAVRSFIMPYDEISIREAILREHYRGGKSYFVVPRIKDIEENIEKLKKLIPEVKIVAAHGRMTSEELDGIMNDFYDGKFDVLMATTIVESGLDVPSANTIIIYKADMYGLAQLYQLRGRVGRGKTRAYAYLTTSPRKTLTKNAQKRLDVMHKLDSLGAGFTLASYDMDIRGFGNLLGDEQSGNIREVGIELYQNMLKEEIEKQKSLGSNDNNEVNEGEEEKEFSVKINLGVSVLIPEDYVKDSDLRMSLYRKLGGLETEEEIEDFAVELVDRFGKFGEEVENLLNTLKIKLICRKLGIEKIDAGDKGAVVSFWKSKFKYPEILISFISKNPVKYKIKENDKFVIANRNWTSLSKRTEELKQILNEILKELDSYGIKAEVA